MCCSGEYLHRARTASGVRTTDEETVNLGTPKNGAPWRPLGCLLLLSTGLWMFVENVLEAPGCLLMILENCLMFAEQFAFFFLDKAAIVLQQYEIVSGSKYTLRTKPVNDRDCG